MFTIGCHVSSAKGYLHMAKDTVCIKANTFQFFTRNPRGGKAKKINPEDLCAFKAYAAEHNISHLLAHAPYTLNPASNLQEKRDFALMIMASDLKRMEETPHATYNLHPGNALSQTPEEGIANTAKALNEVLLPAQTTTVLVETMAGKGSEIGCTFKQIAAILAKIDLQNHVGVCLDTCHVWDAGYDIVNNLNGVLEEFDKVIGLNYLKAIHLNDSKNALGSHKDRHAKIGEGQIGFNALAAVINHPQLHKLPFYLETPNPELKGFGEEIAQLRGVYQF